MSHQDFLSGRTRTWPYGTQKTVTVVHSEKNALVCREDATSEGFVLLGQGDVREGMPGTITFLEGGPTGGYWKFEPLDIGVWSK